MFNRYNLKFEEPDVMFLVGMFNFSVSDKIKFKVNNVVFYYKERPQEPTKF